jgi:hypothetical protein
MNTPSVHAKQALRSPIPPHPYPLHTYVLYMLRPFRYHVINIKYAAQSRKVPGFFFLSKGKRKGTVLCDAQCCQIAVFTAILLKSSGK